MKNIFFFILGAMFITLVSFGTGINVTSVSPKLTLVKSFHSKYNIQDDIVSYVKENVRNGYVVKTIAISEYEDWQRAVVVMEKY